MTRAGAHFAGYGLTVRRVLTNSAFAYRCSGALRDAVAALGAQPRFIKAHCPWTNGKAERFNRTLAHEWAYASLFDSSAACRLTLHLAAQVQPSQAPHRPRRPPAVHRVTNLPRFAS